MTFVKRGVVVPLGGAGELDAARIYGPAVCVRDGKVFLYYSGLDGGSFRIGLAIAEDGLRFRKQGVVVPLGTAGEFDDARVYAPAVCVRDSKVFLYYTGYDGANYRIGLAISEDGLRFQKQGVVVPLGAAGEFDDARVYDPAVIVREGKVFLYYSGLHSTSTRIGLAIAEDGIHFKKVGVVLPLGGTGDFDDVVVSTANVITIARKVYLYYTGYDGANYRIGLAISEDGLRFTRQGVVIPLGTAGEFDAKYTYFPAALVKDDKVYLYYAGSDGTSDRIGLAISESGF